MTASRTQKYTVIKFKKMAGTHLEAARPKCRSRNDLVTLLGNYDFNRNGKGERVHQATNAGDFQQHEGGITIKDKVGPEIRGSHSKFRFARNPWDHMVSLLIWNVMNDPTFRIKRRFNHPLGITFDELGEARRPFSKLVKTGDWQTDDRFDIIDDRLCVDFVMQYKNLAADSLKVCSKAGAPRISFSHLRSAFRPSKYHYSRYYEQETKSIVGEQHKNDTHLLTCRFAEA